MSDKSPHGATKLHASKDSGGGGKWLIAAITAAALVGGGYYVWKSMTPAQGGAEIALNDSYAPEPMHAGPVDAAPEEMLETVDARAARSATETATTPARTATSRPARRATAQAEPVPEATIGVTPASATMEDSEDIVVTAPRRPVWTRTPSASRLSTLYPARALERGREGEATLHCIVVENGALDCERASETPGGFGFAALRVARGFRHATTLADGRDAMGSPVNLRVVFRLEDEHRRS